MQRFLPQAADVDIDIAVEARERAAQRLHGQGLLLHHATGVARQFGQQAVFGAVPALAPPATVARDGSIAASAAHSSDSATAVLLSLLIVMSVLPLWSLLFENSMARLWRQTLTLPLKFCL
jgi:hypothetical protein